VEPALLNVGMRLRAWPALLSAAGTLLTRASAIEASHGVSACKRIRSLTPGASTRRYRSIVRMRIASKSLQFNWDTGPDRNAIPDYRVMCANIGSARRAASLGGRHEARDLLPRAAAAAFCRGLRGDRSSMRAAQLPNRRAANLSGNADVTICPLL